MSKSHDELWEEARTRALSQYDVLDTPREQDFDEIAQLAAEICEAPIAVVNLVGTDRQFFKAEVGLGVRETPIDGSFCAKAVLEQDFMLVPDATQDSRFNCSPLVIGEPHLRFYAGALLKTPDGFPIGTVCVLDYRSRTLSHLQTKTLQVLARQVMAQLELRRSFRAEAARLARENEQIRHDEEMRRTAQRAGRVGTFELDVATDLIEVSEELCEIFGLPVLKTYPASTLESVIVAEDRKVASSIEERQQGNTKLDVEYRIRRPNDDAIRWLSRRGRFITSASGQIIKLAGIVLDITESKQKDSRRAALLLLGDRLRGATSISEVTKIAAETLAAGLGAMRAGYSIIDRNDDAFIIDEDWTRPDVASLKGRHSLQTFSCTIKRLIAGETLSVSNLQSANWLGSDIEAYAAIGVLSFINVPILDHGRLVGSLFAHHSTPRFWSKDEMDFAWGVADRTYAAVAKLNAEVEQSLLNGEISHRLKNTLAMVQAIASQTLKDVTERDAVDAFANRLQALGTAHEVLLRQDRSNAQLSALVGKVVTLHAPANRFEIGGPDIVIGPKAGLSLSLLLHEMATNALKYGALSNPTGVVSVVWHLDHSKAEPLFVLSWQEAGGPAVSEPVSRGFGTRLIRMGLCGNGDVAKRYLVNGLEITLRARLAVMQATTD